MSCSLMGDETDISTDLDSGNGEVVKGYGGLNGQTKEMIGMDDGSISRKEKDFAYIICRRIS
ncbi:hypothetical protein [Paenibacillus sp. MABNR03]|uniref:hypothetical protein n=1 Tax=Paenibacillus sp. MABNR03 TaxID=3142626 RepID=UPI003D2A6D80